MLVLSRNEGQGVTFPDLDLEVKILRITGNRIQVGVDASPHIRALRTELVISDFTANHPIVGTDTQNQTNIGDDKCFELQAQINLLQQSLDIAQRQLDRGDTKRANWTLGRLTSVQGTNIKVSESTARYSFGFQAPDKTAPEHLAC